MGPPRRTGRQPYTSFALGDLEPAPVDAPGWVTGGGSIWSTPGELMTWNLALVSVQVLKLESYAKMKAVRNLSNGKVSRYGGGLSIDNTGGYPSLSHSGAVVGFLTSNSVLPGQRSGVAISISTDHVSPGKIASTWQNLLVKSLDASATDVPVVKGLGPRRP